MGSITPRYRSPHLPIPPIQDVSWDVSTACAIGREVAHDPDVTAVFCGNDETAMGLIRGLDDSGRRVPDDVSVAGFDDHPLASRFIPAITTARQDFAELGRHGTAQLLALLRGESSLALEAVEPPLVFRESTSAPRPHPGAPTAQQPRVRTGLGPARKPCPLVGPQPGGGTSRHGG